MTDLAAIAARLRAGTETATDRHRAADVLLIHARGQHCNRVIYDSQGRLDEVVTDAGAHLERLDRRRWFLSMERGDGSEFCIWFTGTVTMTEERPA